MFPSLLTIDKEPNAKEEEEEKNIERHLQVPMEQGQNFMPSKMRYEYTITKEGGEAEIMKAMSWKKLFKSLLLKYPEFSGWCTYINKKGHVQVRNFLKGRETRKL